MNYETQYVHLVKHVMEHGADRQTRNANTRSVFGYAFTLDCLLQGHFPLLHGRKLMYKGVLGELAAMFKGPKTLADFEREGCNYWSQWAKEDGSINVDYGNTWLNFDGVNQLQETVDGIINNPTGRRHLITGWHPGNLKDVDLPCCHMMYQWYVTNDGYLDMIWYQRSVDVMVGLPSDVILAAAWNIVMAAATGLKPGKITFMLGDTHIYHSHFKGVEQYLTAADGAMFRNIEYLYRHEVALDDSPMEYFNKFNKDSIQLVTPYVAVQKLKFEVHA